MRSRNSVDILNWLKSIIDSCETLDQVRTAEQCIYNFKLNYFIPTKYSWKLEALNRILNLKIRVLELKSHEIKIKSKDKLIN
tara:strand:+ start:874 stop:1119 length:246 start_codon:yes stop_codon:yes gene_type:complete